MTGTVLVDVRDGVGVLTLSNPLRRNAISAAMTAALAERAQRLDADPGVHVVVVRGEGTTAFASGADISEFGTSRADARAAAATDAALLAALGALSSLATPLVAMVHGHCVGAGLAVALCADLRLCDDAARFAVPAARLGVGYPVEEVRRLARVVGPTRAAELLFTGRTIDAAEALGCGLVTRVLPTGALEAATAGLTATIAGNAPLSVRAAKLALRSTEDPGVLGAARAATAACAGSDDAREGREAFLGKRPPRFTGR